MLPIKNVLTIASTLLAMTINAANAQYNVFSSGGIDITDVIVNGQPKSLASVRAFEMRCRTSASAGQWWVSETGLSGPVGGPASYNIRTCRPVTASNTSRSGTGRCTFYWQRLDLQWARLGDGELATHHHGSSSRDGYPRHGPPSTRSGVGHDGIR